MSFVHPLLLGGLALIALPIVIHLIMRQKPRHLLFPAFRFLQQKMRTTRRKLQIRHLLLLLLRILLIVLMCLALARPKLFSERLSITADSPVAVVLLFDTSPSMEYAVNRKSRLDEAKVRAHELLTQLPDGSRVAVFDSADLGGEWAPSLGEARDMVQKLAVRPGSSPLTRQIAQAYRLLESAARDDDPAAGPPPRLLFVFSDRTLASWDDTEARTLVQPESVRSVFLDVGVNEPADLAVSNLELSRDALGSGDKLEVRATVRAVGMDADTSLTCVVDGAVPGEQKPVQLKAGGSEVVRFEIDTTKLLAGPHHIEVKLGTTDALPFDDVRFAAFEVRGGRKVLVLADRPADARLWKLCLEAKGVFRCDVMESSKSETLDPNDLLTDYKAVVLLNVAKPDAGLWGRLTAYVERGGQLAIVPGPDLVAADYNQAARLMPAKLVRPIVTPKQEAIVPWEWNVAGRPHPLLAPFLEWKQTADVQFFRPEFLPQAARYWEVEPEGGVIARYADEERRPAVVERDVGGGRVLLFTTGFDGKKDKDDRWYWNNYMASSFLLVLVNESVSYLAGDLERPGLNRVCGETITIELPATPRFPLYTLQGPGLVGAASNVSRPADQNTVQVSQAIAPGNYTLFDGGTPVVAVAGFSLNVKSDESQLGRVEVEKITTLFGADAVVPLDRAASLRDALTGHFKQPVELLPWLMMALLLVLAFENLLANRFYRESENQEAAAGTSSRQWAFVGLLGRALIGAGGGAVLGVVVGTMRASPSGSGSVLGWVLGLAAAGAVLGGVLGIWGRLKRSPS